MFAKSQPNELPTPREVAKDANSFEILRIWVAGGSQHVVLKSMAWDDPAAWGLMLADVARHLASAYKRDVGLDEVQALHRIKMGFEVEMSNPTDSHPEKGKGVRS